MLAGGALIVVYIRIAETWLHSTWFNYAVYTHCSVLIGPDRTGMDPRWTPYTPPRDRQARAAIGSLSSPHKQQQDSNGSTAWTYDVYQPSPPAAYASTLSAAPIHPSQGSTTGFGTDGDLPMEDADPFNNQKYATRSSQPHRSRPSSQHLLADDSLATRLYSPLHPSLTNPYPGSSPGTSSTQFATFTPLTSSTRHSPTRPPLHGSHSYSYQSTPRKFSHYPPFKDVVLIRLKIHDLNRPSFRHYNPLLIQTPTTTRQAPQHNTSMRSLGETLLHQHYRNHIAHHCPEVKYHDSQSAETSQNCNHELIASRFIDGQIQKEGS